MVRVWPGRAEDDLLVGNQPGESYGVDAHPARPTPTSDPFDDGGGRAVGRGAPPPRPMPAPRPCARRSVSDVPEGASSFPAWCSSTISADSKWGAASSQKRMSNTAPMAKLAAATQLGALASGPAKSRRQATRSLSVAPVVPTTAWMPAAAQTGRVARTASMRVKSTATSVPAWASAPASPATTTSPAAEPMMEVRSAPA